MEPTSLLQPTITYPNFEQMSIELNIQRPESELAQIQYEAELRQMFLNNFKANVNETNQFVYQAVLQILVAKDSKRMSPCKILELLTELRDRIFQNQKEVQDCMENFKQKLRALGYNNMGERGRNSEESADFNEIEKNQH